MGWLYSVCIIVNKFIFPEKFKFYSWVCKGNELVVFSYLPFFVLKKEFKAITDAIKVDICITLKLYYCLSMQKYSILFESVLKLATRKQHKSFNIQSYYIVIHQCAKYKKYNKKNLIIFMTRNYMLNNFLFLMDPV